MSNQIDLLADRQLPNKKLINQIDESEAIVIDPNGLAIRFSLQSGETTETVGSGAGEISLPKVSVKAANGSPDYLELAATATGNTDYQYSIALNKDVLDDLNDLANSFYICLEATKDDQVILYLAGTILLNLACKRVRRQSLEELLNGQAIVRIKDDDINLIYKNTAGVIKSKLVTFSAPVPDLTLEPPNSWNYVFDRINYGDVNRSETATSTNYFHSGDGTLRTRVLLDRIFVDRDIRLTSGHNEQYYSTNPAFVGFSNLIVDNIWRNIGYGQNFGRLTSDITSEFFYVFRPALKTLEAQLGIFNSGGGQHYIGIHLSKHPDNNNTRIRMFADDITVVTPFNIYASIDLSPNKIYVLRLVRNARNVSVYVNHLGSDEIHAIGVEHLANYNENHSWGGLMRFRNDSLPADNNLGVIGLHAMGINFDV